MNEAKESKVLLDSGKSPSCRLVQITNQPVERSSTIYMESPVWSPDGRFFLFQRYPNPSETYGVVIQRHYFICDTGDNYSIRQITDEPRAIAPSMSPDGKWVYYFVDETSPGKGKLTVKRVGVDGKGRETVMVVDKPIAGPGTFPTLVYNLSTIRSDGKALAIGAFLGDGQTDDAPWAVVMFDLEKAEARIVLASPDMCNTHPQYSRSLKDPHKYDLLIQQNHTSRCDRRGHFLSLGDLGGLGADAHVIRDDGTNLRDVPMGRSKTEMLHGHQEWRGQTDLIVGGVFHIDEAGKWVSKPIVEGRAVTAPSPDMGSTVPGAFVRDLTPRGPDDWYGHTAINSSGDKIVTDWSAPMVQETTSRLDPDQQKLMISTIPDEPGQFCKWKYLLNPRSTWKSQIEHPHPCISPDGKKIFFNSDWVGGVAQVWLVTDFTYDE